MSGAQNNCAAGIRGIFQSFDRLWLRYPLVPVAAACVVGILIDAAQIDTARGPVGNRVCLGLWCCTGIGVAISGHYFFRDSPRVSRSLVVFSFVALGGGMHRWADQRYESASVLSFVTTTPQPAVVQGLIQRPINLRRRNFASREEVDPWQTSIQLDLKQIRLGDQLHPCTGRLSVVIQGRCDRLAPGDSVQLLGSIHKLRPPTNPGAIDPRKIDRRRGIHARMDVGSMQHVQMLERHVAPWNRGIEAIAKHGRNQLLNWTDSNTGPLAVALVVGQRELVNDSTRDCLLVTGTAHLLSVSGLHLAIVVLLTRWMTILLRLPIPLRLLSLICVCILYTAVTGAKPPVVRAAMLVGSLVVAAWFRRSIQPLNTLALAAIVLFLLNPELVFSVGVHLSFLAVVTLLNCARRDRATSVAVRDAVDREQRLLELTQGSQTRLYRWTKSLLCHFVSLCWFSLCVSAVSLPLVWYHFHVISLVSVVCNVFVAPCLLVALSSGIGLVLVGWIDWHIAAFFGYVCHSSLWLIHSFIERAAAFPMSHFWLPSPPGGWVACFYLLLGFTFLWRRGRRSSWMRYGLMSVWFAIAIALALKTTQLDEDTIEATFVDVGHGTSVIVRLSEEEVWIYDCGRLGNVDHSCRGIDTALWSMGITRIRGVVLSHADADHFNALPSLLRRFNIEEVVTPPGMLNENEAALEGVRRSISRYRTPVREVFNGSSMTNSAHCVDVLHPPVQRLAGSDNANSLVLRLRVGPHALILPGDLEAPGIQPLINQPRPPAGGVLMAPHHGSLTADTQSVLQWARPKHTIVSGGRRALRPDVQRMLQLTGSSVSITAQNGAIRVQIDKSGGINVQGWLDSPW
ncbi:MAG: DNA internalization-related competence protein ComEC/Rec2 [Planctomycetota bacterium]